MTRRALCFLALWANTACGSGAGEQAELEGTIEIHSWLVNPGEKTALDAVFSRFRQLHPKTELVRPTLTSRAAAISSIQSLLAQGAPPDVFQTLGGADLQRWVLSNGVDDSSSPLESVNAAAQQSGLLDALPSVVRNALSYQDRLYAIPLDVPRVNVILYNARVFSGLQLTPPTNLEEFVTAAEVLRARGIVPLALGTRDGSVVSQMLFDGTLISEAGLEFRDAYLAGRAEPTDPRVAKAVATLGRLLEYTNTDRDNLDWPQAARLLIEGNAAMTITGDWAKGFLATAGLEPDNGLAQMPFFGTADTFAYLVNGFTLPTGASNRAAALGLLGFLGTTEAAGIFTPLAGTMSARLDFDDSNYDPVTRQTRADFRSTKLTLGHRAKISSASYLAELDATLRQFALDRQAAPVLNMLVNTYGQL
jgi:glucose/mannose transport system substrate-binding protein